MTTINGESVPVRIEGNKDDLNELRNLLRLSRLLEELPPYVIEKADKRASVAMILDLKIEGTTEQEIIEDEKATKSFLLKSLTEKGVDIQKNRINVSVLLIKRAAIEGDRWSSHMGLPGGKQELNETDYDTCVREAREEIGVNLKSPEYLCIGRLSDRPVILFHKPSISYGKKVAVMSLSCFIFVRISKDKLRVKLNKSEVDECYLVPLSFIEMFMADPSLLFTDPVVRAQFLESKSCNAQLRRFLFGNNLHFPSIPLSNEIILKKFYGQTLSLPELGNSDLRVWGLTLGIISDMIDLYVSPSNALHSILSNSARFDHFDINFLLDVFKTNGTIGKRSDTMKEQSSDSEKAAKIALLLRTLLITFLAYKVKKYFSKL